MRWHHLKFAYFQACLDRIGTQPVWVSLKKRTLKLWPFDPGQHVRNVHCRGVQKKLCVCVEVKWYFRLKMKKLFFLSVATIGLIGCKQKAGRCRSCNTSQSFNDSWWQNVCVRAVNRLSGSDIDLTRETIVNCSYFWNKFLLFIFSFLFKEPLEEHLSLGRCQRNKKKGRRKIEENNLKLVCFVVQKR